MKTKHQLISELSRLVAQADNLDSFEFARRLQALNTECTEQALDRHPEFRVPEMAMPANHGSWN